MIEPLVSVSVETRGFLYSNGFYFRFYMRGSNVTTTVKSINISLILRKILILGVQIYGDR